MPHDGDEKMERLPAATCRAVAPRARLLVGEITDRAGPCLMHVMLIVALVVTVRGRERVGDHCSLTSSSTWPT